MSQLTHQVEQAQSNVTPTAADVDNPRKAHQQVRRALDYEGDEPGDREAALREVEGDLFRLRALDDVPQRGLLYPDWE